MCWQSCSIRNPTTSRAIPDEGGLLTDPVLEDRAHASAGPILALIPARRGRKTGPGACYQCGMDDAYDKVMKDLVDRAETDAMKRTAPEIFAEFEKTKEDLRQVRAQLGGYKGMLTRAEILELTKPLRFRKDPPTGVRVEKLTEKGAGLSVWPAQGLGGVLIIRRSASIHSDLQLSICAGNTAPPAGDWVSSPSRPAAFTISLSLNRSMMPRRQSAPGP